MIQFFWLYIDDLVGKGLDTFTIVKLIIYLAPTIVPIALPLGVLLASIMTFGNLSESSELTAIKSAGISLWRFTLPLSGFVLLICGAAFLFNNYVIPVANLKFWTLLMDVRNTKPAVNLKAGMFYKEIPGYSLYINKKGNNNRSIYGIMIYDLTSGIGCDKVILAQSGEMYVSTDKKYLIFELKNGCRYEEKIGKNPSDKEHVRLQFKYWKKVFDLSSFAMHKTDDSYLKGNEIMLSNRQISKNIDSALKKQVALQQNNYRSMYNYMALLMLDSNKNNNLAAIKNKVTKPIIKYIPDSVKATVWTSAEGNIRNLKNQIDVYVNDLEIQDINLTKQYIEWHGKISRALSCLVLFFIGVPLGALIRRGGFGLPFISAVIFFVILRTLSVIFEKLAATGDIKAWQGMWLPLIFLSVLAVILFALANRDKTFNQLGLSIKSAVSKFKVR
jgi:lipopolysaccharide export system permease protein